MNTIYEYVLEAMVTPQEQTQGCDFHHFLSSSLLQPSISFNHYICHTYIGTIYINNWCQIFIIPLSMVLFFFFKGEM